MKTLPSVLLLSALLITGCSKPASSSPIPSSNPTPSANVVANASTGTPAPSWKLPDLQGAVVSSEQFKGKVVVVDFWATWCPPCREELPGYVALQKKYAKDGVVIVGVSLDEGGPEVVKQFVQKFGVDYQIVMGNSAVVEAFGGVEGIPTTFIIDRAGNLRDKKVGAESADAFEKRLLAVLK